MSDKRNSQVAAQIDAADVGIRSTHGQLDKAIERATSGRLYHEVFVGSPAPYVWGTARTLFTK